MGKAQSLIQKFSTRDGTLAKDSNMINCYAEGGDGGTGVAILRPGLAAGFATSGVVIPGLTAQGACSDSSTTAVSSKALLMWGDQLNVFIEGSAITNYVLSGVVTPNQPYDISVVNTTSNGAFIVMQGTGYNGLWTLASVSAVKVSSTSYPTNLVIPRPTVPGCIYLDGAWYVMTASGTPIVAGGGVIYGSAIYDPTTWTSLNTIIVDAALGPPQRLWRHLQYLIAMCAYGMQVYYDAGNPGPGSPLSVLPNAEFNIGCAAPLCVVKLLDMTIFVGQIQGQGVNVMAMEGLALTPISDTFVERSLGKSTLVDATAIAFSSGGHDFYILNLPDLGYSLVYDFKTKLWNPWQSSGGVFTGKFFCTSNGFDLVQSDGGQYWKILPTIGTDNGVAITATITTDSDDYGVMAKKFCEVLYLDTDTVAANMTVSYSDDDYTTFSTPYSIDLSKVRKQMRRLGSFFYRAFKFVYNGGVPARFYTYQLGDNEEK